MRVILFSLWLLTLSVCLGENNTVRYKPLKNKDLDEEYDAWIKGSDYYIRSYGLSFEWLEVTTKDNFTIRIHHLWNPRVNGTKIPVLMITGILLDGDVYLWNRPEDNFAMLCANQGYHVFLGSFRSSLSYASSLTSPRRLNFTIDDSAFLDIPPVIDHVLAVTKQPKLHLISISKGVTAVLELLASRTEYNEKVRICMLLSPVSYIEEPVLLVRALMNLLKIVIFFGGPFAADFVDRFLFRDINRDNLLAKLLQFIVNVLPILATCVINTIFTGKLDCFTKVNFDLNVVEKIFANWPELLSSRELLQYTQNTDAKSFQSYSTAYVDRDLLAYLFQYFPNVEKFSLERVSCPVVILGGQVDIFSQPLDYKRIQNELCSRIVQGKLSPNKYAFRVNVSNYNHLDPVVALNNHNIYANAFYMIMREFDIARDPSLQKVLGYVDADFSHLEPQTCQ